MKTEMFTAIMKTIGNSQDEKTRSLIDNALAVVNEKASQEAMNAVDKALESFGQAKAAHTEKMLKLNEIGAAIARSEKEHLNALNKNTESEQSWRSRFRELRGVMTPELKAEHSQQIAGRELAEEFRALIEVLEGDKSQTVLEACGTGRTYVDTHLDTFSLYAQHQWAEAIKNIVPLLARAFSLRLRELEMKGELRPGHVLVQELVASAQIQSQYYVFNMEQEPVLSQLGLHRPALTGVDMQLYKSPVRRTALAQTLTEKKGLQEVKP